MKIWTCGSSPWSGSWNAWVRIKNVMVPIVWATFGIFRHDPYDFLSQLVTMDESWFYHYYPETKQQSMEWQRSGSAHPKKFQVQKSAGKVLALISLGSRQHHHHWLSSKGRNYQRRVLLINAGAIEGHFEGKPPREGHQGHLILARQCPASPGSWNPDKTGLPGPPMFWSPTRFSRSWSVGLPPVPSTEKNNWNVAIVHPTQSSSLPRRPGCTDKFLNVFEWLAKVRVMG